MILSVQFYNYALQYCLLDCLLGWEIVSFLNAQNIGIDFIFYFICKLLALQAVFYESSYNNLSKYISAYFHTNYLCYYRVI